MTICVEFWTHIKWSIVFTKNKRNNIYVKIGDATKQVIERDQDHKLRTYEIAQQTLDILQHKPVKKKRRISKKKPTSKDITAYLDL